MSQRRPCRHCGELTGSVTSTCWRHRPAPSVRREGDAIIIDNDFRLTPDQALTLAHRIADAVAP